MNVLNLYCGLGGNRQAWTDVTVTAVEYDPEIARIYASIYPDDTIIVADAHAYLLDHFREFDFIWTSPPCPSHSRVRKSLAWKRNKDGELYEQNKPIYPSMILYEEILLLDHYYDGLYAVENVRPFYNPLIEPQIIGRHCVWANFPIEPITTTSNNHFGTIAEMEHAKGISLDGFHGDKKKALRNCVNGDVGLHILEAAKKNFNSTGE